MLFEVTHLTRYVYDRPVVLEPLIVRLRPRSDLFQRQISFELVVDPPPGGSSEMMDVEGNVVTQLWFIGSSSMLDLRTTCTVETLKPNPFDYVVLDPEALAVPAVYSEGDRRALERYLEPPADPAVGAFAAEALKAGSGGATAFLGELCSRVASSITQENRAAGDPMPAGETLARGSGACRDLAVLFIEACRSVGIAARFVTGYELGDPEGDRDLHAWAEVYLNGAGWRGYDPSQGLAVADRHVAVAAGPGPLAAAPTSGTFRGTDVAATLETVINLRVPTFGSTYGLPQDRASYQAAARKPVARMAGLAPPADT
jgi:transglutaminase-like putative cysteine protease